MLEALERDAATACRHAAEALDADPITRGTLLSHLVEHESFATRLDGLRTIADAPMPALDPRARLVTDRFVTDRSAFASTRTTTAVLRLLRRNAEIGVRAYRAVLDDLDGPAHLVVRDQCNAWLRQRAWLGARVDAFSGERAANDRHSRSSAP